MARNESRSLGKDQACKIVEECYDEVLAYCRRHAPVGYDPNDLAQETFLRFVRAKGYAERGRPIAYLMRVARSVCVDAYRQKRPETVALDFELADTNLDERETELEAALARLPEDLREAVELRFGSRLHVGEVAKALGISRFSTRRRINAALRMLQNDLERGDLGE